MDQRFTKTREHNAPQSGEVAQAFHQSLERIHCHLGIGSFPDVANAGAALEVATGGRPDIKLSGIGQTWVENQIAFPFIEPVFASWGDMPAVEKRIWENQPALFVGFHLGHGSHKNRGSAVTVPPLGSVNDKTTTRRKQRPMRCQVRHRPGCAAEAAHGA